MLNWSCERSAHGEQMSEQANLSGENEISSWAEGACAHLVVEDLAALLLSFTVSLSFLVGADFIAVLVEAKENVFPGDVRIKGGLELLVEEAALHYFRWERPVAEEESGRSAGLVHAQEGLPAAAPRQGAAVYKFHALRQ
jgi:hypothetical protein